ncbi:MAG: hypothetical protein MJY56_06430 [Bacteroidales bacterium]|nr:hypothetical protein [Bacteroidales bacterium]
MMKRILVIFGFMALSAALCCCNKEEAVLRIERSFLTQNATSSGLSVKIPVRASGAYSAVVPADAASWCHPEIKGVYIDLTIDPLDNGGNRETTVTVSSAGCHDISIKVAQSSVMVVNPPKEISLSNGLRSFSLTVISGSELEFSYPDWISPVDDKFVAGEKTYTFEASELDGVEADKRSGSFVIKALSAGFRLEIPVSQVAYTNAAIKTMIELWKTSIFSSSPLDTKSSRYSLLMDIEAMCNEFSRDEFHNYLDMQDAAARSEEEAKPILALYNYAFEHVLSEIQSTKVASGTAVIWMLYNAGFIVKTPSVTFGMAVNHRYAVQLAPYLDFITVSHSDSDHIDNALMNAMDRLGKPVLTNFHTANSYCATEPTTYHIGDTRITTSITDENSTDKYCTTVHRIKLGEDAGGLEIIHTGDSSYDRSQFTGCLDGSATNILILRYGSAAETNILGGLPGQTMPDCILLCHLEELRHYPFQSPKRAAISDAVDNMNNFNSTVASKKVYMPFWGEKMVWKNGRLQ